MTEKGLTVQYDFPEGTAIYADEGRIRQVIENFATNAVKYSPSHGVIRIRITQTGSQTVFSMENESPPLPQEALDKVWDTFYRAEHSRSGKGTGLGLAVAKQIIQLHDGTCAAENTKTGVRFYFTL